MTNRSDTLIKTSLGQALSVSGDESSDGSYYTIEQMYPMFECRLSPMQEYLYEFLQCAYRFRGLSCERLLFDITTSSVARFSCYPQAVGCEMSDPTPWMHHLFLRHEMGWILQILGPRQDNIKNKPRLTYRLLYNRKSSTLVHRLVSSALSQVVIDTVDNIIYSLFENDMIV